MASQVYVSLNGPQGGASFGLSTTEGTWGELVDLISGLSLGEIMAGKSINQLGSYATGNGVFRVRNTQTNVIKAMGALPPVTEEQTEYLDSPFTVDEYDVVEGMTQVVA